MRQINPKYLQKDEIIEFADKPSMMSFSCMIACLWSLAMLLPGIMIFFASLTPDSPKSMMIMPLINLILALPAIYLILTILFTQFVITNKGLITKTGIVINKIKVVNYKHITSVGLKENIFGKLFHYATLCIDTSGSGSSIGVTWKNVKAAYKVKRLIEEHINADK